MYVMYFMKILVHCLLLQEQTNALLNSRTKGRKRKKTQPLHIMLYLGGGKPGGNSYGRIGTG